MSSFFSRKQLKVIDEASQANTDNYVGRNLLPGSLLAQRIDLVNQAIFESFIDSEATLLATHRDSRVLRTINSDVSDITKKRRKKHRYFEC